jgi:osmotically-inducible protein OsmY
MARLRTVLAVMLATAAWCSSATAGAPAPARPKPFNVRSDAEIEKDIRARLAKSKISRDKFQVHVQGGIATLEGTTDVIQHKGVATRLAKSGGASAVANKIQISEAAREKAAKNLETGRRRAQIKRGEPRSDTPSPPPFR